MTKSTVSCLHVRSILNPWRDRQGNGRGEVRERDGREIEEGGGEREMGERDKRERERDGREREWVDVGKYRDRIHRVMGERGTAETEKG